MSKHRRSWPIVAILVLCSAAVGEAIAQNSRSEIGGSMVSERFFFESVDVSDRNAVMQWARELCNGLDVAETAATFDIPPTREAVAGELMKSLPTSVQADAVQVCVKHLAEGTEL